MASETTAADEVRYSGLETKGMRKVFCSMLLPESRDITCGVGVLRPSKVTVKMAFGSPNFSVDFPGAGVILLTVKAKECDKTGKVKSPTMPKIMAVAGRCKYTPACHKDFKIMMRTKKEGKASGLGKNSEFKWPDVESLGLCPVCATRIQPSKKKQYYMLFHLIFQQGTKSNGTIIIGTRLQCQLCCLSCLEGLVKDKVLTGSDMGVMDAIAEMPGMPLFVGDNFQGYNKEGSTISPAWQLFRKWEREGAFQALTEHMGGVLNQSFDKPKKRADANAKICLTCKTTLLPETASVCSRCKKATYCSRECQRTDWKRHKLIDCVDKAVKAEVHLTASLEARGPVAAAPTGAHCGLCKANAADFDKGPMIMCFCCGTIQLCGLCARKDKDWQKITGSVFCIQCRDDLDRVFGYAPKQPAIHLEGLLKMRPPDCAQVPLARLMMAQCKIVDAGEITGCDQDVAFAKSEYLALADSGYALAQQAVASFYMRDLGQAGIYFGPLDFVPMPSPADMPFEIDHEKAKHYSLLAAHSEEPSAMNDLAVLYKNGLLFETNKPLALEFFLKSATAGDPHGMCNAAHMLWRADGVPEDCPGALMWYRRAAKEHDWEDAKVILIQMGHSDGVSQDELAQYWTELFKVGFFETTKGRQVHEAIKQQQNM